MRNLDRTTLLLCSAAKLALDDARLEITDDNADDVGAVTATTLSIAEDIKAFTKDEVEEGSQFINPALFPPTTMNFPSSQLSIRFKPKAFNATISTGYTSGLDALKYAVEMIRFNRAKTVLVGGVESLTFSGFVGFYKIGFLSGGRNQEEISCPFDIRHNGIVLGEGSTVLILEEEQAALSRGAAIYGEVLSVASSFDAYRAVKYDPKASGLKQSMREALIKANLCEDQIHLISAAANAVPQQDRIEVEVIKETFNIYAENVHINSLKSMIGENVSAAGCFQVAASLFSINSGMIPATLNYKDPDPDCVLSGISNKPKQEKVENVLINNFGPGGHNSTAIISKYE
ncbi:MAG: beta-ketoacyl synthase N-terminal-like domain-containing protein [Candidatus Omnitrophica bacterium]|nr:beta-ketoacyl synthase N-terminal-like domain-containing protein [Candidatus Omnitrophota bacterium]